MSQAAMIGGAVGLAFAVVEFFLFGAIIRRAERRGEATPGMRVLDTVRHVQLVAFPVIGALVAPTIVSQTGV